MKRTRYQVIFLNDMELTVHCIGFQDAIITAMHKAIERGWVDNRIKYITDEEGVTIKDIKINFQFSK